MDDIPNGNDSPQDAILTSPAEQRRCWNCGFYSFKIFASETDSEGKCFRDYESKKGYYWVNGNMVCPKFIECKCGD